MFSFGQFFKGKSLKDSISRSYGTVLESKKDSKIFLLIPIFRRDPRVLIVVFLSFPYDPLSHRQHFPCHIILVELPNTVP